MKQWLIYRWVEKDNFLYEFCQTGKLPDYGMLKPTPIQFRKRIIYPGIVFVFILALIQAQFILNLINFVRA